MEESFPAATAHQFSQAADALVDACRKLEQCGLADEPIEALLQSLEVVTHQVHRLHRPDERLQIEPADAAPSACRMAATGRPGDTTT